NINVCDYICFLAPGGRLAYFGPPNEAKTYFDKDDFAEIYSSLEPTEENPDIPLQAEARFKASPEYQRYVEDPLKEGTVSTIQSRQQNEEIKPPKRGNPWRQFLLLSMRYIELIKNDVGYLLILLLQAPLIGLLLLLIVRFLLGTGT